MHLAHQVSPLSRLGSFKPLGQVMQSSLSTDWASPMSGWQL